MASSLQLPEMLMPLISSPDPELRAAVVIALSICMLPPNAHEFQQYDAFLFEHLAEITSKVKRLGIDVFNVVF